MWHGWATWAPTRERHWRRVARAGSRREGASRTRPRQPCFPLPRPIPCSNVSCVDPSGPARAGRGASGSHLQRTPPSQRMRSLRPSVVPAPPRRRAAIGRLGRFGHRPLPRLRRATHARRRLRPLRPVRLSVGADDATVTRRRAGWVCPPRLASAYDSVLPRSAAQQLLFHGRWPCRLKARRRSSARPERTDTRAAAEPV
jgi:hypothetical protein